MGSIFRRGVKGPLSDPSSRLAPFTLTVAAPVLGFEKTRWTACQPQSRN
jgi:hypothetical protein